MINKQHLRFWSAEQRRAPFQASCNPEWSSHPWDCDCTKCKALPKDISDDFDEHQDDGLARGEIDALPPAPPLPNAPLLGPTKIVTTRVRKIHVNWDSTRYSQTRRSILYKGTDGRLYAEKDTYNGAVVTCWLTGGSTYVVTDQYGKRTTVTP